MEPTLGIEDGRWGVRLCRNRVGGGLVSVMPAQGSLSVHRTLRRNAGVRKTGPQRAPSLTDEQNTLITGRVKANPRARRVGETDYALHLNPAKSSDTRDQRPSPIP